MLDHKISGLPVVDQSGKLVGILTESDIFRMLVQSRVMD
jgi:CBS domain-containing protein